MRLRHVERMALKVAELLAEVDPNIAATIQQKLPRIRYQMWSGKWQAAMHRTRGIYRGTREAVMRPSVADRDRIEQFRKHLLDLGDYLRSNWSGLTNYALAHRLRLRISSAPASLYAKLRILAPVTTISQHGSAFDESDFGFMT
jgi:hypothetical protein